MHWRCRRLLEEVRVREAEAAAERRHQRRLRQDAHAWRWKTRGGHSAARARKSKAKLVRRRELRRELRNITDTKRGDEVAWAYLKGLAREASNDARDFDFIVKVEKGNAIAWAYLKGLALEASASSGVVDSVSASTDIDDILSIHAEGEIRQSARTKVHCGASTARTQGRLSRPQLCRRIGTRRASSARRAAALFRARMKQERTHGRQLLLVMLMCLWLSGMSISASSRHSHTLHEASCSSTHRDVCLVHAGPSAGPEERRCSSYTRPN